MEVIYKKIFNNCETHFYKPYNELKPPKPKNKEGDFFGVKPTLSRISTVRGEWYFKFKSKSEEILKENYNNLITEIHAHRVTIVVEKDEKKVAIKVFENTFLRRVGEKFFRKTTYLNFMSYRFKDGALFYGEMYNYHKKRKYRKKIRRFTFGQKDIIGEWYSFVKRVYSRSSNQVISVEDNVAALKSFVYEVHKNNNREIEGPLPDSFYKLFLDKQGIKYPNNFMAFSELYYPTIVKKDYLKNDYNFIDALMSKYGFKGKKLKRILHKVSSFDTNVYLWSLQFFGEKFINSQDDYIIKMMFENCIGLNQSPIELTTSEKNNAFNIFYHVLTGTINVNTFQDHIRFYRYLSQFEKIRWNSNTHDEFNDEHYEFSEKYNEYTIGNFTRNYNEVFIKKVEEVILDKDHCYKPQVLLKSVEYNEESSHQSNCVRTYIKRPDSLIISLRRDNRDRATIEYRITSPNGKDFDLNRVQTLGRFNNRLDDTWNRSISLLDDRVYSLVDKDLFDTITITSESKINNLTTEVKTIDRWTNLKVNELKPKNQYTLKWSDGRINQINGVDDIPVIDLVLNEFEI